MTDDPLPPATEERSAFLWWMHGKGFKPDSIVGRVLWRLWQAACAWQRRHSQNGHGP
jgi:hypothetical protein